MSRPLAVLLVEEGGRTGLRGVLRRNEFAVTVAQSAEAALFEYGQGEFDAVVASMSLPGMGAVELCAQLRQRGRIPVVVVGGGGAARGIEALDAGADDHLDLPCDERELKARLNARVRRWRGPLAPNQRLLVGALEIRICGRMVDAGPAGELTELQASVLHHLATRPGSVVERDALARRVADDHGPLAVAGLDAGLEHLRVAIVLASGDPDAIQHVPPSGWRLNVAPSP